MEKELACYHFHFFLNSNIQLISISSKALLIQSITDNWQLIIYGLFKTTSFYLSFSHQEMIRFLTPLFRISRVNVLKQDSQ